MSQPTATTTLPPDHVAAVERVKEAYSQIRAELAKVIVGQDDVIEELLITLFARGHCLLVGVPGLAKTLLINSLSRVLSLRRWARARKASSSASAWATAKRSAAANSPSR